MREELLDQSQASNDSTADSHSLLRSLGTTFFAGPIPSGPSSNSDRTTVPVDDVLMSRVPSEFQATQLMVGELTLSLWIAVVPLPR